MSDPATREDLGRIETAITKLAEHTQNLHLLLVEHDTKLTGKWEQVEKDGDEAVKVLRQIRDHQANIAKNGNLLKGKQLVWLILGMAGLAVAAAFGSSVFVRLIDAAGR